MHKKEKSKIKRNKYIECNEIQRGVCKPSRGYSEVRTTLEPLPIPIQCDAHRIHSSQMERQTTIRASHTVQLESHPREHSELVEVACDVGEELRVVGYLRG
jgi:hypothetical protein